MNKNLHIFICIFFSFTGLLSYGQKGDAENIDFSEETLMPVPDKNVSLNPDRIPSLKINYHKLKQYFNNFEPAYIENGSILFNDLYQNELDIDINSVTFSLKSKDSMIKLDLPISPESSQKLFVLNEKKYLDYYGGKDFMAAKINSYNALKFYDDKQIYSKKHYQLWDWKSLNHPPVRNLKYPLEFYDAHKKAIDYDTIQSLFFNPDIHRMIDKNTNSNLTFGNKLELLLNGDAYQKKLELIRNAQSSILISVMSYYKDSSSLFMTNELIKKANEGVQVYLIVEKVWTKLLMKKGMRPFKKSNVVVIYADDLLNNKKHHTALFHNKIFVFDDKVAIVGGQNIIDSDNISSGYNHQSRDSDLLIEGPAVTDIAHSFIDLLEDYHYEKKSETTQIAYIESFQRQMNDRYQFELENNLRGEAIYKDKLLNKNSRLDGVCRFVIQGPRTDRFAVSKAMISYFKYAQNSIDITSGKIKIDMDNKFEVNAYEGWSKRVWNELFSAAEDGIDINIINNGVDGGYGELSNYLKRKSLTNHHNKFIAKYYPRIAEKLDVKAAKRNYPALVYLQQKQNIDTWMYFQYMHSKTFMIDRFIVSVGSYNLDNWSADKSHEAILICQDKELAKTFEYQYTLDKVNSTPVILKNK